MKKKVKRYESVNFCAFSSSFILLLKFTSFLFFFFVFSDMTTKKCDLSSALHVRIVCAIDDSSL